MAGALATLFKDVAKKIVADLGTSLDTTITYTVYSKRSYQIEKGSQHLGSTTYSDISVPIEFITSEEDTGRELREAKIYITPDLIGNNQPTLQDEVILSYAGSTHTAQVIRIDTRRGGQTYLYTILVRF